MLIGLLLLSVLVLTPGQPSQVLGVEVTALGLVMALGVTASAVRTHIPVAQWYWTAVPVRGDRGRSDDAGGLLRHPRERRGPALMQHVEADLRARGQRLLLVEAPALPALDRARAFYPGAVTTGSARARLLRRG